MNPIEQFVKRYELRSMNTVKNYRCTLNGFFKVIEKDPNTYFDVKDKTVYEKDITDYYLSIIKKAPKSRDARLFCVKSFFMRNGVDIQTYFWKDLSDMVKEKGSITEDEVPNLEQLQQLLNHAGPREHAWILFSSSSGTRIGEILQLKEDDVKLDEDPVRVLVSGMIAKKGYKRTTFISQEAKIELLKWLKIRQEYLDHVKEASHFVKRSKKDYTNLIFPFTYNTADVAWKKLLKKTGLYKIDERTKRITMSIHSLRKYAKTRMLYHMPEVEVNYIIGHRRYLSGEYERPEIERVAKSYKKAEGELSVFMSTRSEQDMKHQIEDQNKKIESMYLMLEKMTGVTNKKLEKEPV